MIDPANTDHQLRDDRGGDSSHGGPSRSARVAAGAEMTVRNYWQRVWLDDSLDALDDLVADETVWHTSEGTKTLTRQALRRRLASARAAIRVEDVTVNALCADGGSVWVRLTLRGVSLAALSPMTLVWIAQHRVTGGRIVESWTLHQSGIDWSR